ncbi:DUF6233 domain-containing protein [Streptomyces sp. NPDC059991]
MLDGARPAHAVNREQALAALTEGVPACDFYRPDTALGVLE